MESTFEKEHYQKLVESLRSFAQPVVKGYESTELWQKAENKIWSDSTRNAIPLSNPAPLNETASRVLSEQFIAIGIQKHVILHALGFGIVELGRGQNDQVLEAEYETLLNGTLIATDHTKYTGTGFVAGYDHTGTMSTKFNVTVSSAGLYNVVSRYSAGPVGTAAVNRTVGLYVNGTKVKDITFTGTGNWETWAEELESLNLVAGTNTIEFKGELANQNDCINLDNISVGLFYVR